LTDAAGILIGAITVFTASFVRAASLGAVGRVARRGSGHRGRGGRASRTRAIGDVRPDDRAPVERAARRGSTRSTTRREPGSRRRPASWRTCASTDLARTELEAAAGSSVRWEAFAPWRMPRMRRRRRGAPWRRCKASRRHRLSFPTPPAPLAFPRTRDGRRQCDAEVPHRRTGGRAGQGAGSTLLDKRASRKCIYHLEW